MASSRLPILAPPKTNPPPRHIRRSMTCPTQGLSHVPFRVGLRSSRAWGGGGHLLHLRTRGVRVKQGAGAGSGTAFCVRGVRAMKSAEVSMGLLLCGGHVGMTAGPLTLLQNSSNASPVPWGVWRDELPSVPHRSAGCSQPSPPPWKPSEFTRNDALPEPSAGRFGSGCGFPGPPSTSAAAHASSRTAGAPSPTKGICHWRGVWGRRGGGGGLMGL